MVFNDIFKMSSFHGFKISQLQTTQPKDFNAAFHQEITKRLFHRYIIKIALGMKKF